MEILRFSILVVIIGLILPLVRSMRFDLQSGTTKCITEEIKSNSMSVGKYTVISPDSSLPLPESHKITCRVTSPYGNNYHFGDHVEDGNYAFTAAESGDYLACFLTNDHKPAVTVSIEFEWKTGIAAKDWSKVAKRGQVEMMELELKRLYDKVASIHDEMFYLREREEEMQALNRATNSKMGIFGILSLMICLFVAALQIWHLKTFFERKKLL